MTLKDTIEDHVTSVFLNTDQFADTITLYRRRGGSTSVTAIVDEATEYRDGEHIVEQVSVLTVLMATPESAIEVGDSVRRSTDTESARWLFDGEVADHHGVMQYRFVRTLPAQYGGNLYGREV